MKVKDKDKKREAFHIENVMEAAGNKKKSSSYVLRDLKCRSHDMGCLIETLLA